MSEWTIVYGSDTKSAADWGVTRLQRRSASLATGTISFEVPVAGIEEAPPFAVNAMLSVQRDGVNWFTGRVARRVRSGSGAGEALRYTVADPWWWFENVVAMRLWRGVWSPHLALNWDGAGLVHTRQSLLDICSQVLQFALGSEGIVPFTIGYVLPGIDLYPPVDEVRDVTCDECARRVLRWHPDVVQWFDHTTSPPTLHIRRRSELTAAALVLNQPDVGEYNLTGMELTPRYDLVRPTVIIRYEKRGSVNNEEVVQIVSDAAGGTGFEPQSLVTTIDLAGMRTKVVRAEIAVEAINPTSLTWWQDRFPMMSDPRVKNLTLLSYTRKGGQYSYPNELIDGTIHPWMVHPISGVDGDQEEDEVTGVFSYSYVDDAQRVVKQVTEAKIPYKFKATNLPGGWYENETIEEYADPQPVGLAAFLYAALKDLQYDGEVTLVEDEVTGRVALGRLLTVSDAGLTSALVQEVLEDVDLGTTQVRFGVAKHLSAQDIVELLRLNRVRTRTLPSRAFGSAGELGSGGQVKLGAGNAQSQSPWDDRQFQAVMRLKPSSDGAPRITLDALPMSDDTTAVARLVMEDGTAKKVNVRLTDCKTSGGIGKELKVRECEVCVNGVTKRMLVLSSEPYEPGT